jgi:altronate dehydratase small subunit
MAQAIVINVKDNVAVALEDLSAGDNVRVASGGESISVRITQPIPFGHKFALRRIAKGQVVTKYGETIGRASIPIARGEYAHTHNIEGTRGRGDLEGDPR